MSNEISDVQSGSPVPESSGTTRAREGIETVDSEMGQQESLTSEVLLSSRKAIKDQSPDEQAAAMVAIVEKVKSGKYVSELGFWKNFCAWIQSIFINSTRGEILLGMFLDEIGDQRSEFYSALVKKLPGLLSENKDLRENKILEKFLAKVLGDTNFREALVRELPGNENLQEFVASINSLYCIIIILFAINTIDVPSSKGLTLLRNKLIVNTERKILTTVDPGEIEYFVKVFSDNVSGGVLAYFCATLEALKRVQNGTLLSSLPIISDKLLTKYVDIYKKLMASDPNSSNNVFLEKFSEKLKDESELYNFFLELKTESVVAILNVLLIMYTRLSCVELGNPLREVGFDDLVSLGAYLLKEKNESA